MLLLLSRSLCAQKYMAEICPLSCGTCTHSCNDTDVSCGSWAQAGECDKNPQYMRGDPRLGLLC